MRTQIFSFLSGRGRPGWRLVGTVACLLFTVVPGVWGQAPNQLPMANKVLTNISQIWEMPQEERAQSYRIQTEVVIYYFDPQWDVVWGECLGKPAFLPIADSQPPLKVGQRVAIDGVVVPIRERFDWDKTKIRILEEGITFKAQIIHSLGDNPRALDKHMVLVEGLLDHKTWVDATHAVFRLLVGDTAADLRVYTGNNKQPLDFKVGDYVRVKGVYSCQFDKDGNPNDIGLWVSRPADVEIIGSLSKDPSFDIPITSSEKIRDDSPTNNMFHVEGIVQSHESGKWVTIWDADGQVMVQSPQTQPLRYGDRIEAIGYPYVAGVQQCLRGGLYRMSVLTNTIASTAAGVSNESTLRLAERVRDLSPQEIRRHLPVSLRGVVTWSHAKTSFIYVQDASGGIRVVNPKSEGTEATRPGRIVTVQGKVGEGDFVPVVTNAVVGRVGYWDLSEAPMITLEQALTGAEDGRWVQMRGYVRHVTRVKGLIHFDLSTSSGEFQAWVPASQPFINQQGSIIRVQGACAAIANARHQLTGIEIWVPAAQYVQVEEPAPDDLFAAPMCPLGNLRRFNMENTLNRRIRTSGTVVLHVPGRHLYVQDGADSVFALSEQKEVLHLGDRVEVVGFPGNEGRKYVLREAAYRRISAGAEPTPTQLPATHSVNADLEGLLAKGEGILLNKVEKDDETHLLIQAKDFVFEASLGPVAAETEKNRQALELGSRLALTGVYEMQSDEYGQPRSFLLHLRSWNDVQVLQQPPWWTLTRLLWVLAGVLVVFLIGLIWGILIARKNALLHQTQTELQAANDRLEIRVAERTRELQDQVTARERAHTELAQAQRSLMLASRQAGMAEVATGVLHNVGNVLNSVNVSTTLLRDQVRQSETHTLLKAAELLKQKNGDPVAFLTSDPKGKLMPELIFQIAGQLQKEQDNLARELEQLAKNVDHIKDIVAMQQSYASVAGVVEEVSLTSLVEDAIQINAGALTRHGVRVIRQFEEVPSLMIDKHKVLQILINFIRNAKYALDECTQSEKRLIITIAKTDGECVMVRVEDNGIGIPPENLTRIFSHGFTTRSNGHGFGLHLGALNAREMGGSLSATSEGTGRGATFALILPMYSPVKKP